MRLAAGTSGKLAQLGPKRDTVTAVTGCTNFFACFEPVLRPAA
jgi:hypothetical protein